MISQVVEIGPSPVPGCVRVSGYITDFGAYERHGTREQGGWLEQIERQALEDAVRTADDEVFLSINGGPPVAKSPALRLSVDDRGLKMIADLHATLAARVRGGHLGFAYRVAEQQFRGDYERRIIQKLHLGEIGIITDDIDTTP